MQSAAGLAIPKQMTRSDSGWRAEVSHLPKTPACIDYTMWKAVLWANEPFYSVKYDTG